MAVGFYLLSFICVNYVLAGPIDDPPGNRYDVIVIGCGVSGLAATAELGRNGKRVLCLEAADRIGGRVRTVPFGDGLVEMGAEWIHGTIGSVTYDLAMAHNVAVKTQGDSEIFYRSHEGPLNSTLQDILNKVVGVSLDCLDKNDDKSMPMGDKIVKSCNEYLEKHHPEILKDKKFLEEFYASLNLGLSSYEAANDWNELSTSGLYEDLDGDLHMSWHELGYKTLFDIILNKYNGGAGIPSTEILLNTEVTNITWGDELVTVTTRNLTTYITPRVIVTLSVGVLKERHVELFSPQLPKEKIDAINDISIGVLTKIIVSFDRKWWPTDKKTMDGFLWKNEDMKGLSKDIEWILKVASASRPMGSNNTMTFWSSGDLGKQIETMPDSVLKSGITKILQTFYGEDVPEPKELVKTNWHSNPYTRGSYSYDNNTVSPTSRSTLSLPVQDSKGQHRLLFAGEATNVLHYSTVHGAYETGLREANRVLGRGN